MKKVFVIKFCLLAACFISLFWCGTAVAAVESTNPREQTERETHDNLSNKEQAINLLKNVLESLECAVKDLPKGNELLSKVESTLNTEKESISSAATHMTEFLNILNNVTNNVTKAHQKAAEELSIKLGNEEITKNSLNDALQKAKELSEKLKLTVTTAKSSADEALKDFSKLKEEEEPELTGIKDKINQIKTELENAIQTTTDTTTAFGKVLQAVQKWPDKSENEETKLPDNTQNNNVAEGDEDKNKKRHSATEGDDNVTPVGSETNKKKKRNK